MIIRFIFFIIIFSNIAFVSSGFEMVHAATCYDDDGESFECKDEKSFGEVSPAVKAPLSIDKKNRPREEFIPLTSIPGITKDHQDVGSYVNALYRLAIILAAMFAVVKIILAGVKYMFSEIVTDKGEAKKDIYGALLGLLIILSAVLVLGTINSDFRIINSFPKLTPAPPRVSDDGPAPDPDCDLSKAGGKCGCEETYTASTTAPGGFICKGGVIYDAERKKELDDAIELRLARDPKYKGRTILSRYGSFVGSPLPESAIVGFKKDCEERLGGELEEIIVPSTGAAYICFKK